MGRPERARYKFEVRVAQRSLRRTLVPRLGPPQIGPGLESRHCALNALRCLEIIVRHSEIVVVSAFPWKYPKVHREAFVTTETYCGRPSRVPEGCLKLIPRPWWSLGACKFLRLLSLTFLCEPCSSPIGHDPVPAYLPLIAG
ncbi:hypothetical protein CRG98_045294 [Punica granatum]|uniref:Uncharacterized protein n=1 Tax=Punica granatum TaxID=22663 RepID=A0A2I0HRV2_PUNGR|nr:hypothetical protein CRG98_045294 [Punica granatum]